MAAVISTASISLRHFPHYTRIAVCNRNMESHSWITALSCMSRRQHVITLPVEAFTVLPAENAHAHTPCRSPWTVPHNGSIFPAMVMESGSHSQMRHEDP
jgi:hypothetical protein